MRKPNNIHHKVSKTTTSKFFDSNEFKDDPVVLNRGKHETLTRND